MTTITTQLVIDLAKKIKQIDPRVSAYVEGGFIKGCFRGKGSETYSYLVTARQFEFNNGGSNVRIAVEKAISELLTTNN